MRTRKEVLKCLQDGKFFTDKTLRDHLGHNFIIISPDQIKTINKIWLTVKEYFRG